jgi:hypothetical protein
MSALISAQYILKSMKCIPQSFMSQFEYLFNERQLVPILYSYWLSLYSTVLLPAGLFDLNSVLSGKIIRQNIKINFTDPRLINYIKRSKSNFQVRINSLKHSFDPMIINKLLHNHHIDLHGNYFDQYFSQQLLNLLAGLKQKILIFALHDTVNNACMRANIVEHTDAVCVTNPHTSAKADICICEPLALIFDGRQTFSYSVVVRFIKRTELMEHTVGANYMIYIFY